LKPNNLLSHLSNLEGQLNHFSFEELTSEEASQLKKSFMSFKYRLEEKVLGPQPRVSSLNMDSKDFNLAIDHRETNGIVKSTINREGGKLLAKVGDEIRTPLNGIIESVDFLKEGNLTSAQILQLNSISNSSNDLLEIINELLEYTKLTSGKEKFESIDFNFYSIIKDTLYLCNTLIINKDVALKVELDPEIPEVLNGDPSKLSQILLTLVGNSIKLIEKGSVLLNIKLRKYHYNGYVLDFELTDSGADSFSNDTNYKAFSPYKEEATEPNSGISLAIIKGIIEILNGSMVTMGTLGNGPAFKFSIPYKKGTEAKRSLEREFSGVNNLENSIIDGLRVLVFEDNILMQKIIEQRLKSWGCIVYMAHNRLSGVDYLHQNVVDLVLMDLRIPEMSGLQLTQAIRESLHNHINNVPIIALSGDITNKVRNKCRTLGINEHITKPYSPDELLATLYKYKKEIESKSAIKPDFEVTASSIEKETFELSLTDILEECMGEIDLLEELIDLFKQSMLDFIGRANIYIPEGDFNRLGFAAHKVKSGLSMMKADKLYGLVDAISACCKSNRDLPKIGRLYDQLILSYPIVENAIDKELMALKNNRK